MGLGVKEVLSLLPAFLTTVSSDLSDTQASFGLYANVCFFVELHYFQAAPPSAV